MTRLQKIDLNIMYITLKIYIISFNMNTHQRTNTFAQRDSSYKSTFSSNRGRYTDNDNDDNTRSNYQARPRQERSFSSNRNNDASQNYPEGTFSANSRGGGRQNFNSTYRDRNSYNKTYTSIDSRSTRDPSSYNDGYKRNNTNSYNNRRNQNSRIQNSESSGEFSIDNKSHDSRSRATNDIIEFVKSNINLNTYRYQILETTDDLSYINDEMEYVQPIYNGRNMLLLFFKKFDTYYSVLVDRSGLSRQYVSNLDYTDVKVHYDDSIYRGTIIDGVYLSNRDFIVYDVYMFKGAITNEEKMLNKLLNMKSYIRNNRSSNINDINLIVNNIYNLRDINIMLNRDVNNLKNNNYIKGLSIHPARSGSKLLYMYLNNVSIQDTVPTTNSSTIDPSNEQDIRPLWITKTGTVDVYILYDDDDVEIGIASIPTLECSKFCRGLFSTGATRVRVSCKNIRNKLVPQVIN